MFVLFGTMGACGVKGPPEPPLVPNEAQLQKEQTLKEGATQEDEKQKNKKEKK